MMEKKVWVDAICGKGFPDCQFAGHMVKDGLAVFSGNQWNEDWKWKREKLEKLSTDELKMLYYSIDFHTK